MVQGIERLPIALASALLWVAAVGAGMCVLRRAGCRGLSTGERVVFGGALGMGVLSLATFVLGTVSGRPPWLFAALCWALLLLLAGVGLRDLAGAAGEGVRGLRAWSREATRLHVAVLLLAGVVVFLALTRANVPVTADYDSLEYHFAAPAVWWRAGRITFLRDVVYANFPLNVEMLYLLAMNCFGGPLAGAIVGQQVGIGFVVLTAGAILCCGHRLGSAAAGRAGAAIFLATPMLGELATQNSYVVELPMTAYAFLALYAFLLLRSARGDPRRRLRLAALCGAMAGLAIGCKYPAVLFVLVPLGGFILVDGLVRRREGGRPVVEAALVGLVALAVASPWLVRNAVNTGNPTYPLLYRAFGGGNWSAQQEAKFAKAHRSSSASLPDAGRRFWAFAAWREQPGGDAAPPWRAPAAPLLFVFALVPLAAGGRVRSRLVLLGALAFALAAGVLRFLPHVSTGAASAAEIGLSLGIVAVVLSPLRLRGRAELLLAHVHFVFWFVAWYALTHRVERFLEPATPGVAVVAGFGVAALGRGRLVRVARWLVAAGLACAAATTVLVHLYSLGVGLVQPADAYLRGSFFGATYSHDAIQAINKLDKGAVVLFLGETRTFYCRRRALAATVFDRQPIDRILEREATGVRARRVRDGLRELGVTHLYVNWAEIKRLGDTYAYKLDGRVHNGFSDHVNFERRELVTEMLREGCLRSVPLPIHDADGKVLPVEYVPDRHGDAVPAIRLRDGQGNTIHRPVGVVLYELR